ncbi:MAG: NAD-dependent epimerase/dehydratase family protein [Epsilonproteobacteria bacterium]|nr:NAD-dependent epimerase/dehydratase family protein [Campylobacterota bacterium]
MRVLITGIEGFSGKHLRKYLSDEYEIFGTSLHPSKNAMQCDITSSDIKTILNQIKPHYIIHLAGISFVGSDRNLFYRVNTLGVENLLQSIEYDVKKIIIASSAVVYGAQSHHILDENMPPNPINHYGLSKFGAEQIAKTYFDKYNIIITRPFNYTGIYQSSNFIIPKIVSHFAQGKKVIELGNIDVIREFNDVNFVCEAYKRLLQNDISSQIVNIASNRGIKLLDVISMMEEIAGYKIEIKTNPKFVRKNEIPSLTGSCEKLCKLVGEIPQRDFKETLLEMYNYQKGLAI